MISVCRWSKFLPNWAYMGGLEIEFDDIFYMLAAWLRGPSSIVLHNQL